MSTDYILIRYASEAMLCDRRSIIGSPDYAKRIAHQAFPELENRDIYFQTTQFNGSHELIYPEQWAFVIHDLTELVVSFEGSPNGPRTALIEAQADLLNAHRRTSGAPSTQKGWNQNGLGNPNGFANNVRAHNHGGFGFQPAAPSDPGPPAFSLYESTVSMLSVSPASSNASSIDSRGRSPPPTISLGNPSSHAPSTPVALYRSTYAPSTGSRSSPTISVTVKPSDSGSPLELKVPIDATVAFIKFLIQERGGSPYNGTRLIFAGKELQYPQTLQELKVMDRATILSMAVDGVTASRPINVTVSTTNGKNIGLQVPPQTDLVPVGLLNDLVQRAQNIPAGGQELLFGGKQLQRNKMLSLYRITDGARLQLA